MGGVATVDIYNIFVMDNSLGVFLFIHYGYFRLLNMNNILYIV